MPRNTCRPSECAASQDEPEASANNNNNNNNNNNEGIIKQELEAAPLNKCKKNILNNNVDQKIVLSRSRLLTPFSPV